MSNPTPEFRPCDECEHRKDCAEDEWCFNEGPHPDQYDPHSDDQHNDPMGRPTVRIPSFDPRYWK